MDSVHLPDAGQQEVNCFLVMVCTEQGVSRVGIRQGQLAPPPPGGGGAGARPRPAGSKERMGTFTGKIAVHRSRYTDWSIGTKILF